MPKVTIRGGRKFKAFIKEALRKQNSGVRRLEAGFFETARYPDGTPVAAVAAWNELGNARTPERPFFRQALEAARSDVRKVLRENVDPRHMIVDPATAGKVGETVKGHIQERIVDLKEPPNAPRTIERKGSSNPLVDTSVMRQATTWKIPGR